MTTKILKIKKISLCKDKTAGSLVTSVCIKYSFKRIFRVISFIVIILVTDSAELYAQIGRNEIIGAYIYNFAKHTETEKYNNKKFYEIALISENKALISELKKLETNKQINKKPITVTVYNNSEIDYDNTCLIFTAQDKLAIYPEIYDKSKNKKIILVTENYNNKSRVMLNLYDTDDNKVLFEINKGNIFERKLKISTELLLTGGSEIDIIELYMKTQRKLNESTKKLEINKKELEKLTSEIKKTREKAEKQQNLINKQLRLINHHKKEQNKLISVINNYKSQIEKQKTYLNNEIFKLKTLTDSLSSSKNILKKQQLELKKGASALELLKDEINKKNKELEQQKNELKEQYDIIKKKETVNNLFFIIIILGTSLFTVLFIGYVQRKKKNTLLKKQKEELSSIIEKLKETQQQLIQSEKMASLGILTAGIAHEINNPVNFIYTGIHSLKKDFKDIEIIINKIKEINPDDKDIKAKIKEIQKLKEELYFKEAAESMPQTIKDIKTGADRTAEIIKGLQKFSRTDENMFITSNIHEYIKTSLLILRNEYKNSVKIIRHFDKEIPEIDCNPGKITQVFMNILSNSIDAIKEKKEPSGKIIIATSADSKNVKISFKDNGTGISKKIVNKIFDPFFTTKDVGKGTGLGMSVSYGIIKEHKGNIEIKTEEGKGTEFVIILPKKQELP